MAFLDKGPKVETNWRGIVLLGRNVQSYKFALAEALLETAQAGVVDIALEELAVPFSRHLCRHLMLADKQGTAPKSRFLDACRAFNRGDLTEEELYSATVQLGFNWVLDAFHVVGREKVPTNFFSLSRARDRRTVHLSDAILQLATSNQIGNLFKEVEARWRLVETAWDLGVPSYVVSAQWDDPLQADLVTVIGGRRRVVTGVRGAIGGYQKGRCFYCFANINLEGAIQASDVDHVIPFRLQRELFLGSLNLDGVWNLVLSCRECNRGARGKFDSLPTYELLDRLHRRNEFFIESHHPLRETLIAQTGRTPSERAEFLRTVWQTARDHGLPLWRPETLDNPLI